MKTESIKALDEAIFSLQGAKNNMEFHADDRANAELYEEEFMTALNTYLLCLDRCHKEVKPLADALIAGRDDKWWDMMDSIVGYKFKRIP